MQYAVFVYIQYQVMYGAQSVYWKLNFLNECSLKKIKTFVCISSSFSERKESPLYHQSKSRMVYRWQLGNRLDRYGVLDWTCQTLILWICALFIKLIEQIKSSQRTIRAIHVVLKLYLLNIQVLIYDLRSDKPLLVKDHHYGLPIKAVDFHPQAGMVVSTDSKAVRIWDLQTVSMGVYAFP